MLINWAYAHMHQSHQTQQKITLNQFAIDFFIPGKCPYEKRHKGKCKSFGASYFPLHRGRLTNYILPRFGPLLLSALRRREIDDRLIDLTDIRTKLPLSNESKNKIHTFKIIMDEE